MKQCYQADLVALADEGDSIIALWGVGGEEGAG
jgi:hypothetical protein